MRGSPQLTLALESWQEVTGSDLLRGHGPPPTEGGHVLLVSPPRRGRHGQGHCGLGRRLSTGLAFLLPLPSEACRGAKRKVQKGLKVTIGVTALQGAWWLDPHRCSGQCDLVLINLHSSPTTEAPARLTSGRGDQVAQAEGGGPVAGAPPVLVVRCWPPTSLHTWLHVYAEPRPNPPWKSVILSETGQCSVSDIWWDNGAPAAAAPRGSPNVGKV